MSKFNIYNYVGKDKEIRQKFCGVFHDSDKQMAVASDCHVLVATTDDYRSEYAGEIRNKDGLRINEQYPTNWASLFDSKRDGSFKIDRKACRRACEALKAIDKLYIRGIGITDSKTIGINDVYFDREQLLKMLDFMDAYGFDEITTNLKHHRYYFIGDEKREALFLPKVKTEEDVCYCLGADTSEIVGLLKKELTEIEEGMAEEAKKFDPNIKWYEGQLKIKKQYEKALKAWEKVKI